MIKRFPDELTPAFSSYAYQVDLYAHYRSYLHETPVFRSDDGTVYLTRYSDCVQLLGGDAFRRSPPDGGCNPFSAVQRLQNPLETMISHWMVFLDPPRHDVIRKAFMQSFSAKSIHQLAPVVRNRAVQLLDALPREGEVELMESFAFPLPVFVIAEILGVPECDFELFRSWSAQLTMALDSGSEEELQKGTNAALQLKEYFTDLLQRPQSLPSACLIRQIMDTPEIGLTSDELLYNYVLLLWAGHETTKNLIANGIQILAERPAVLADMARQPELLERAIEEMLRFESPVQKVSRWTHDDAMFGEYFVARGTLLTTLLGAANRDDAVFEQPDTFKIQRPRNRHIAFGTGIHHCLGAFLARVEARIAFEVFLPKVGRLEPVEHQWRTFSAFRSMEKLAVRVYPPC